jgi:hypothetical protein
MKFSFKLGVLCGLLLVVAFASSRADFAWELAQGPPSLSKNSACAISPSCIPDGCQNPNPPPSVVPDGGKNAILVKSYEKAYNTAYGTCQAGGINNCYGYPNVACGAVRVYGMPNCVFEDRLGFKTVYSGSCNP